MKKPDKTYPLSVVADLVKQMPDKLFAHIGTHAGQITTTVIPANAEDEQVFIRKDALLEWLKEELRNAGPTTLVQYIINKLNSL